MHQTSIDNNIGAFTYIRVAACLFIVLLHTLFASNVYFSETITDSQLLASETVEHLLMWAVPMFLMVTGALLLKEERIISMKKLFGKYIKRIVIALLSFTLLFQILDYIHFEEHSLIKGWLLNLFQGHSWAHMWYLYLMIGIYLMIPFYKMIASKSSINMIWYLIGVIVLFVSVLPLSEYAGLENGFYIPTSLIYPVYVFAGYALTQRNISPMLGAGLLIISTLLIVVFSIVFPDTDIFGYDSIMVVAQSIGLFSLLIRIKAPAGTLIRSIDDCSFGIYLIHMIGVRISMKWIEFDPYSHMPILSFAGMVIMFFVISYFIAFALRSIPKLNLL